MALTPHETSWPTQENIQLPLLYQVAAWNPMDFYRGQLVDLVMRPLAELYNIAANDRDIEPKGKFYEIVMMGKWKLKASGHLQIDPGSSWSVTERGFRWLRSFCSSALASLDAEERLTFLAERDEFSGDLFLNVLRRLHSDSLDEVIEGSSAFHDMLPRAVSQIPLEEVAGFLLSARHLWHLLFKEHIRRFRRSPVITDSKWPMAVGA